uniref:putative tRNA pseudouridine synthase isoform X2 n=1 Tax=Erigeron canadensis TaxID=72917 RepID=UPI001CB8F959|nr:putative tRNA pseudouridine synthase isoform X2 [Erigeron canadensis]
MSAFIPIPIFTLSFPPLILYNQTPPKIFISNPNNKFKTNSTRVVSCSSFSQSQETLAPLQVEHSVNSNTSGKKWEGFRKRKVLMRVGYAGYLDYRAIEKELEIAIYRAGGIRDSNFGDLKKITWATSSQIDDEVHSLSTMISFKLEIPENAWIDDPNGIALVDIVNTYLPINIKVFSILPSQKSFNAKEECNMRKYGYLLPLEVIGITSNFNEAEIEHHLSVFNDILCFFEGKHPFHNYTIPSEYHAQQSPDNEIDESNGEESVEPEYGECDGEEVHRTYEMVMEYLNEESTSLRCTDSDKNLVDESDANNDSLNDLIIFAKWLHEPDENDRITDIHFRRIFQCSCGKPKHSNGVSYVEISICGESFMPYQIRKMVGSAVAAKRGLLPRDESGKSIRPEILAAVESEEILKDVEDFYELIMLPQLSEFLDPLKSPWKEWVELLDENTRIPDSQLGEVRNAWVTWEENFWVKTDAALYYSG